MPVQEKFIPLPTGSAYRRRWRIAWLLGIGVLVNYFDRVNLSISQAALHHDFGIGVGLVELLDDLEHHHAIWTGESVPKRDLCFALADAATGG